MFDVYVAPRAFVVVPLLYVVLDVLLVQETIKAFEFEFGDFEGKSGPVEKCHFAQVKASWSSHVFLVVGLCETGLAVAFRDQLCVLFRLPGGFGLDQEWSEMLETLCVKLGHSDSLAHQSVRLTRKTQLTWLPGAYWLRGSWDQVCGCMDQNFCVIGLWGQRSLRIQRKEKFAFLWVNKLKQKHPPWLRWRVPRALFLSLTGGWGSFTKGIRVVAWVQRFAHNARFPKDKRSGDPTLEELTAAKHQFLLCFQHQ